VQTNVAGGKQGINSRKFLVPADSLAKISAIELCPEEIVHRDLLRLAKDAQWVLSQHQWRVPPTDWVNLYHQRLAECGCNLRKGTIDTSRVLSEFHKRFSKEFLLQLDCWKPTAPFHSHWLAGLLRVCEHIRGNMLGNGGSSTWARAGLASNRVGAPKFLRFCPACLCDDSASSKELYWRRLHQMTGIEVCSIHRVFLEESCIRRVPQVKRLQFKVPPDSLRSVCCRHVGRHVGEKDEPLLRVATLGQQLFSDKWPCLGLAALRERYLHLLGIRG
jgi:hypothetical protein